ncbi:MAG: hypothetical protein ACT6RL_02230 [Neoaquamicrobium sediminum]|uniref:hypothetical protein n=1 Tax=Neoaquamicrobium sediminum TaxID=1849104 RepID=UPI0040368708
MSKEHVIPFGLGGEIVLPRSSCEACREKTRKVEEFCLRNHLGNTRISLGVQTRHPAERPDSVKFRITESDGSIRVATRRKDELPIFLVMPVYPAAFLLRDAIRKHLNPPKSNEWIYFSSYEELAQLSGNGGAVKIGSMDFVAFARFLAKMAHGYLVCERGLRNFTPLLTPLITQQTTEYWHWVGGTVDWSIPAPTDDIFQIQTYTHNETGYIIARIRIFPNLNAPTYHAVAGREL